MPPVIYKLIDRCEHIYTQPHEFPEFSFSWLSRERRSQRREALALVAKALVLRMDLASQRVGKAIPGTPYLQGLPIEQLAAWAGLNYSRAARAVQDFTRATYQSGKLDKRGRLCAPQPKETTTDPATGERGYRSRPAVRRFERLFFRRLGVTFEVDAAAKRASAKRKEAAEKDAAARADVARLERARLHAIRETRILEQRSAATRAAEASGGEEEAARRRHVVILFHVRLKHPDWTQEAQRAEAARLLIAEATGPPE